MNVFENDLNVLRGLLAEDEFGTSMADILGIGALHGLATFFDIPPELENGMTKELEKEYDNLRKALRVKWIEEIDRDRARAAILHSERKREQYKQRGRKRKENNAKRALTFNPI